MNNGSGGESEISKSKFSDDRLEQIIRDRIYWERGIDGRLSVNDAKMERLDDELREVRQQLVATQKENSDTLRQISNSFVEMARNFERFMAEFKFVVKQTDGLENDAKVFMASNQIVKDHEDCLKGTGPHNPGIKARLAVIEMTHDPSIKDRVTKLETKDASTMGKLTGAAATGSIFGALVSYIAPHITGWKW